MRQILEPVTAWMADRANNAIEPGSDLPAFDNPLFGCASGADPLFAQLKRDIGPGFYWTPEEAYRMAFPDADAPAGELSVIAWVLPQTAHTRAAHRKSRELPSIEWSRARHYGEMVNENLRGFVVAVLTERGITALAPTLLPQWGRAMSERFGFASNWSERHAAYACGLGTFGLSDGLITPAGKAVRVGSVVARMVLPPTPRSYTKHDEWCLRSAKGTCKACIKRCPAGAISEAGHDKVKCKDYIRNVTAVYVEDKQLGFRVNSCGLCQTGTPCEARNPTAPKRS
jgi:epoxyqueuosine reductase